MDSSALSGMLVVNKPKGLVSKNVSRIITRRFGRSIKLGHVGTLDPLAEGVLPILFGKATRLQDPLLEHPKTYRFRLAFGYETDTLDLAGKTIAQSEKRTFSAEQIEQVLGPFRGEVSQVPPLYSAIKLNGEPLYSYARNQTAELPDFPSLETFRRQVRIHDLRLIEVNEDGPLLEVTCSKGTYVRSLGRDIAYALGSCATLTFICRTAAAGVTLDDAISVERIESIESLAPFIVPIEKLKTGLKSFHSFGSECTKKLRQGQKLLVPAEVFAKSVGEFETDKLASVLKSPLFILDESGKALGVGMMQPIVSGLIEIHMTRGLQ